MAIKTIKMFILLSSQIFYFFLFGIIMLMTAMRTTQAHASKISHCMRKFINPTSFRILLLIKQNMCHSPPKDSKWHIFTKFLERMSIKSQRRLLKTLHRLAFSFPHRAATSQSPQKTNHFRHKFVPFLEQLLS